MNTTDRNLRAVHLPADWRPSSWRERTALQLPAYPDADALATVLSELHGLPPLVTSWEILTLKQQLAEAQEGKRFLLQGGDCAENFTDCSSEVISNRLKVLLQMSLVLVHGLRLPVVRVGRFAGQYAKPRSADLETRDGVTLPSYRGDMVNAPEFTLEARTPEPRRMIKAHARSAMTMNFVRSLIDGGFADLHHPEYWDLGWVGHSPLADDYRRMVAGIGDAVRFMETLSGAEVHNLNRVDFYTSHEALAAAVRGSADAAGAAAVGLVQPQHPFPLDRHAHRRRRRRTYRIFSRHPQPDRDQDRSFGHAGAAVAPDRRAQSR